MPSSALSIQASLLAVSAIAIYLIWVMAERNGTIAHMQHIRDFGPHILPGTQAPLKKSYTGIQAVDYQLTVLILFFWEIVDGSHPHASLHAFRFGGQIATIWGLIMIEGMRFGNKGRFISYVMILGAIAQNASFAVTMPLFLALYLATSPTVSATSATIGTDVSETSAVPLSLTLGYIIPAVMLSLPAPSLQSFEAKQTWIAAWQAFPLWTSACQQVVKIILSSVFFGRQQSTTRSLAALRMTYAFLLILAGVSHIAAWTLTATSIMFPSIFAAEYAEPFGFAKVNIPAAITPATKMPSIGSGAFMLLQYDELVGFTSVLLWASFMYVRARNQFSTTRKRLQDVVIFTLVTAVAGPAGAAVAFIWARDELVLKPKIE